jgi:hypothetical protein
MSEEGNKNPRKTEESAKELPLPLDLVGLAVTAVMSSSLVINGSKWALLVRHSIVGY